VAKDPWLPRGFELQRNLKIRSLEYDGTYYQIYALAGKEARALLAREDLRRLWVQHGLVDNIVLLPVLFGPAKFFYLTNDQRTLAPVFACPRPDDLNEALAFATALHRTRQSIKDSPLSEAIYLEKYSLLLPTPIMGLALSDDIVLGRYLSGGVEVSCFSRRRLKSLVPGLPGDTLERVIAAAGLESKLGLATKAATPEELLPTRSKARFTLAGRSELELFFLDHTIDIVENPAQYQAMGINSPSSFVLYGPPGCGKTYAVEKLAEYLDWPVFTIDSGSVGSMYIHETSRKIADIFQTAMEQSPAVVIIDEMEAFLSERDAGGHHRIEEVAEFLRKIPEAQKWGILIIGMTNRLDLIDPAILRRGRFDHLIKVEMPTTEEVLAVLTELFEGKPLSSDVDLKALAVKLAGRPLSDVSYFVREAARLTAKGGKMEIDKESATAALSIVLASSYAEKSAKIGF
jgi:cell division protease FtsH